MANVENESLQSAINNAAVGEIITLTKDVALTSRLTISNIVTIDLNGHVITANFNDGYGAIYISPKGELTIKDSSLNQSGGITNTVGDAIGNYGTVNIYGGTFIGYYALYNFYHSDSVYGISTIYGGTFNSHDGQFNSVVNCGDLTVAGGNIQHLNTTSTLSITGGTVNSLYIGTADYNPEKQSTSISGGNIKDFAVADGSGNKIAISGGTFGITIDKEYLVDGFEVSYDEGTGEYKPIDNSNGTNSGLKVIATSSSRVRDLVIKNGQLIFIKDIGRIAFDYNNTRVFYNQIVELDTESDRLKLEEPLNGYYFVIDSAVLWRYQDEWIQITEKPEEVVFVGVELPELGQEGKIYVDTDDREISVWDEETDKYIVVSNYTEEITDEDIEELFD